MFKVNSHWLLVMTLFFSTAHAPTFQLWGFGGGAEPSMPIIGAAGPSSSGAAAIQREYAEEDDIQRFQLDELYLPNLDVSLPELFEWSALERAYLADLGPAADVPELAPEHSPSFMRIATIIGGPSLRAAGGSALGGSASGSSNADESSIATGGDESSQTGKGDSSPSDSSHESLPADESDTDPSGADDSQLVDDDQGGGNPLPTDTLPEVTDPLTPETPVPVPAPGALVLFALGLAGLQLAGRNKNRRG